MAVDIQQVCAAASNNQASQDLALGLSVLFAVYTFIAIALSGTTIVLASNLTPDGTQTKYKRVGDLFVKDAGDGQPQLQRANTASAVGVPLVSLSR